MGSLLGFSNSVNSLKQRIVETNNLSQKVDLNAKLAKVFYQHNLLDSALHYNYIAGNLAASNADNYPYNKTSVFINRILFLFQNHNYEAATNEAFKLFKDTADTEIFSNYNKMVLCEYYSVILTLEGKSKEAIYPLQRALDIGKEEGAKLGNLYSNMGAIFYEISNYEKARTYYELAKQYDDVDEVIINANIVTIYVEEKKFDEALKLLATIISETDSITQTNYQFFNLLGMLQLSKGNYNKSIQILLASNKFMEQHTTKIYFLVDNYSLLGDAYILKYEATNNRLFLNEAKNYIELGLSMVKKTNRLISKIDLYFSLTKILTYQNDTESAITSFKTYRELQDSLYRSETNSVVEELDQKYNASEKQKEIALLKTERIAKELTHQKDRNELALIISLSILMSLILLFLYFTTKSKKKRVAQELHIESLNKRELESLLRIKESELNKNIGLVLEKNKLIQGLRTESNKTNSNLDDIIEKFEQSYISDKEWGDIQLQFDSIYGGVLDRIQLESGKLTPNDIKLFVLMKLQYSNGSMAEILKISYEGVKKAKQRLSKKVNPDLLVV